MIDTLELMRELDARYNTHEFTISYTTMPQSEFIARLSTIALDRVEALEKRIIELEKKAEKS